MPLVKDRLDLLSVSLLILLCASWGMNQVAIKAAVTDIPPMFQGTVRSLGAGLLLFAWMRMKQIPIFTPDRTLKWGILVGLLFSFEFVLVYWGLEYTTASRSVIFINTSPFVVAVGAQFFIPNERLTPMKLLGLILAFCGIIFAFNDDLDTGGHATLVGDLMLLGAAALWGATTVVIKSSPLKHAPGSKVLLYQLTASALAMPVFSLVMGETLVQMPSAMAVASLVYQTVWVAFVTYLIWFWMLTIYPASLLAPFTFLAPLFGVLAGALLLGEPVTAHLMGALALVATGIYLVNRPPRA